MLRDIRAADYDGDQEAVLHWRSLPASRLTDEEIGEQPNLVMTHQQVFLAHFEECVAKGSTSKLHRLFTLLPVSQGYGIKHIHICTSTLYGLVRRSQLEPELASRGLACGSVVEFRRQQVS